MGKQEQRSRLVQKQRNLRIYCNETKDVAFREDDCPIRKDNAPENFALLCHIALNLLSQEKTASMGIQNKRLQAAWDDDYLALVLGI